MQISNGIIKVIRRLKGVQTTLKTTDGAISKNYLFVIAEIVKKLILREKRIFIKYNVLHQENVLKMLFVPRYVVSLESRKLSYRATFVDVSKKFCFAPA